MSILGRRSLEEENDYDFGDEYALYFLPFEFFVYVSRYGNIDGNGYVWNSSFHLGCAANLRSN